MNRARSGEPSPTSRNTTATSGSRSVRHCSSSSLRRSVARPAITTAPRAVGRSRARRGRPAHGGPTSSRKTSSSVGRARSNDASRTPASTTSGRIAPPAATGIVDADADETAGLGHDVASPTGRRGGVRRAPRRRLPGPVRARGGRSAGRDRARRSLERTLGHEPAPVEDRDSVADPLDVRQDVGREHDGRLAAKAGDQLEEVTPALRIERADRLVEEHDRRSMEQGLGDPEALAHPARPAADPALASGSQAVRSSISPTRPRSSAPREPARAGRPARAARDRASTDRTAGPGRDSRAGGGGPADRDRLRRRPRSRCRRSAGPARSGSGSSWSCRRRSGRAGRRSSRPGHRGRARRGRGSARTAWSGRGPGSRARLAATPVGVVTPPPARRGNRRSGR